VLCVEPGAWTRKLRFAEGHGFSSSDEQVILIDHWIAGRFGVALGDVLECYPGNDAPEGESLRVVGVLEGVSLGFAVIPLETGRRLFGLPELATGAQVASAQPEATLENGLWQVPGVESVFSMRRAAAQIRANFEGSERVLLLALFMAIAVSIIFLGVLAALDAAERAPDYVVLASLGWRRRSLIGLCLTEVMTRGLLALTLGLALAPFLANELLDRIAAANHYRMELAIPPALILWVVGIALLALPLSALPALRTASRQKPALALRRLAGE
jgi:ABC-type lipoprotein release transport system permease subunit